MNKDIILKKIDLLSKNAMFNMSLTSRELFHSNFWAWLIRKYPIVFSSVFDIEKDAQEQLEIYREKYHFDLCFQTKNKIIIIENKLKSLPNKAQLEQYEKLDLPLCKECMLISYFKPLFNTTWKCLTYKNILDRIKKCFAMAKTSYFEDNDNVTIQSYIEFLDLLIQFQDSIEIHQNDTIENLLTIIKDSEIQKKLNKINFAKTFERIFTIKLTEIVLENFEFSDFIDNIRIDCGRDLKIFSDILFYFPNAWDKDRSKRQDLCYLGISLWENYYRYYAGLHKAQCKITLPKNGRSDKENKNLGFKYLNKNYSWLFHQESDGDWNGYSYSEEMYLYKKINVSSYTVSKLAYKVQHDLGMIYKYLEKEYN